MSEFFESLFYYASKFVKLCVAFLLGFGLIFGLIELAKWASNLGTIALVGFLCGVVALSLTIMAAFDARDKRRGR